MLPVLTKWQWAGMLPAVLNGLIFTAAGPNHEVGTYPHEDGSNCIEVVYTSYVRFGAPFLDIVHGGDVRSGGSLTKCSTRVVPSV